MLTSSQCSLMGQLNYRQELVNEIYHDNDVSLQQDSRNNCQIQQHPDPIPLLGVNVALLQRLMNEGENDHIIGMKVFKCQTNGIADEFWDSDHLT